jgi:hypothetical protein
MSNSSKIAIAVVVIAIIALGIWYVSTMGSSTEPTVSETTAAPRKTVETQPVQQNQNGLSTSASDTSDSALVQDLQSVNTQMQGLSNDSAAVNQSFQAQ